ncbi:hypothetical protein C2G38_2188916 [Gigaspora rosea]|uniref:Uncharacterized protein n=1 Tax=Gigaspora rosea TaxID=44941 RepID=A0A397V7C9_9GLOM|nr:hypothetical protein C2G38_2188916 [Gigaspora rosea]
MAAEWYKENKELLSRVNVNDRFSNGYIVRMFLNGLKGNNATFVAVATPKNLTEAIAAARRVEASNYYGQHNSEIAKQLKVKNELSDMKKKIDEMALNYAALTGKIKDAPAIPKNKTRNSIICFRCKEMGHISREFFNSEEFKTLQEKASTPNLLSNLEEWTNENFKSLKATLQHYLPHVRYFQIPSEDAVGMGLQSILSRVKDKSKAIDYDDIMKDLYPSKPISSIILSPRVVLIQTFPSRTTEPFLTIINEIADTYSATNYPYEFKLLLRGTRDGFTPASFWNLRYKQTNVVIVAKVNDTDGILGGYNYAKRDKLVMATDVETNKFRQTC